MKTFSLQKPNGKTITATAFEPSSPKGKTLLISAATGIKQKFYYHFAEYCAEAGYHVYTYDYSGIGLSKNGDLRGSEISYTTWGAEDFPAMVRFIRHQHGAQPMVLVGHSFGGNCLGVTGAADEFEAIVTIASQQGYWRNFGFWYRWVVLFVFAVSMPLLSKLFGYFPSKTHGLGEDLPKKVAEDWSKLILNKEGIETLASSPETWRKNLHPNMLVISISDDMLSPKKAVDNLAEISYSATSIKRLHLTPKDGNAGPIGHLNFFRKQFRDTLWQIPLQWFEQELTKHDVKRSASHYV